MAFATNQNNQIHYQVTGEGPPLVLMHGFTGSIERWRQFGYVEDLQKNHTLVMIDALGHGLSDKPHDVEVYNLVNRVAAVVAVLDDLKIEKADYWGYSMGGWTGFGMAKFAPQRIRSLTIGAAHPYPDASFDSFAAVDGSDAGAFIFAFEKVIAEPVQEVAKPFLLDNDLRALAASARPRPSMEDVLSGINVPCHFYVGTEDARREAVQRCAEQISKAEFSSISGTNHATTFLRSDLVLPLTTHFFNELGSI
jgi:pimeloyl-ACP methyl ester carboxylesterase